MNRSIGGYFEWEFPAKSGSPLHPEAVRLNSARYALEYILRGFSGLKRIWVPYFTCEVVLEPLRRLGVGWEFYHINDSLEIDSPIELRDDECIVYTNYYGIKDAYVPQLVEMYGNKLVVDNAQALYCAPIAKHQFYSPRKFVGMPDGGLAITDVACDLEKLPKGLSFERCSHLLKRIDLGASGAYGDFQKNDESLSSETISLMSNLSSRIYDSIDYERVRDVRRKNFEYIHKKLGDSNRLKVPPMDSFACPLVYPYWSDRDELKKHLIERKIFVATYWPNVFEWCQPTDLEYELAKHVVCIPVDQRYGDEEMNMIAQEVLK